MIDAIFAFLSGVFQVGCVVVLVLVAASIVTAMAAPPAGPMITDDWERRQFGRQE